MLPFYHMIIIMLPYLSYKVYHIILSYHFTISVLSFYRFYNVTVLLISVLLCYRFYHISFNMLSFLYQFYHVISSFQFYHVTVYNIIFMKFYHISFIIPSYLSYSVLPFYNHIRFTVNSEILQEF